LSDKDRLISQLHALAERLNRHGEDLADDDAELATLRTRLQDCCDTEFSIVKNSAGQYAVRSIDLRGQRDLNEDER